MTSLVSNNWTLIFYTPKFLTKWHMQKVQAQIRLLPFRSSLIRIYTCLPFHYVFKTQLHKITLFAIPLCILWNNCITRKMPMALGMGFSKSQWKELFLLHVTHLLILLFIPTKYESNPLKKKGNIQLWKKVNQKVNSKRCPMPAHQTPARQDIAILKDRFFLKTCPKINLGKISK